MGDQKEEESKQMEIVADIFSSHQDRPHDWYDFHCDSVETQERKYLWTPQLPFTFQEFGEFSEEQRIKISALWSQTAQCCIKRRDPRPVGLDDYSYKHASYSFYTHPLVVDHWGMFTRIETKYYPIARFLDPIKSHPDAVDLKSYLWGVRTIKEDDNINFQVSIPREICENPFMSKNFKRASLKHYFLLFFYRREAHSEVFISHSTNLTQMRPYGKKSDRVIGCAFLKHALNFCDKSLSKWIYAQGWCEEVKIIKAKKKIPVPVEKEKEREVPTTTGKPEETQRDKDDTAGVLAKIGKLLEVNESEVEKEKNDEEDEEEEDEEEEAEDKSGSETKAENVEYEDEQDQRVGDDDDDDVDDVDEDNKQTLEAASSTSAVGQKEKDVSKNSTSTRTNGKTKNPKMIIV